MKQTFTKSMILTVVVSMVVVPPAFAAYVDPNTGGMLFQLLAILFASLTAIMLFFSAQIRMAFARSKRFVRGIFSNEDEPSEIDESTFSTAVEDDSVNFSQPN